MKLKIALILVIPALSFSCLSPPKNIIYFQDLDKNQQNITRGNELGEKEETVIRKFDELLITVSAPTTNQDKVAQFNLPLTTYLSPGSTTIQQTLTVPTFTVDHEGSIFYPVIGRITLEGMTRWQAIEHIKNLLSDHIENPSVYLRILTFRVTVLGEVRLPGVVYANREGFSIIDAIGLAGDLTIYGNRENVLLIREKDNNSFDFIRMDLTKSDIFSSPYFYLQQDDKIIIEPNKTRQSDSRYGVGDGYKLSVFSMIFSAISVVASTAITIISLRKN